MRGIWFLLGGVIGVSAVVDIEAQRRGARTASGSATFAVVVTDPEGAPVPGVLVTVEGPTARSARTEGGRIAFEGLRPGSYRLRFEREGFITLERELTARGGAPIDVKVTLNPAPPPPPPPEPVGPQRPAVTATPEAFDVPEVFEKEYVGRGAGKTTPLACGNHGSAVLIQLRDPLARHEHAESDEFLYVIGGEGNADVGGREERLHAGVLLFVPRGAPHGIVASGRNPLVLLSTRAGEGCKR